MSSSFIFSESEISHLRSSRSLLLVSGGRDSVFLLHAFAELKNKFPDVNFEVLHFNHNLRGAESDQDQILVQNLCERFGVTCHVESLNFSKKSSLQNTARNKRRKLAVLKAIQVQAKRIVMAHHAGDQLETLVMKTLRGAGISGLCGMRRQVVLNKNGNPIEIFRPMLHLQRDSIDDYFTKFGESFREDSSNQSTDYLRNRVRQQISQLWTDLESKQDVLRQSEELQMCERYLHKRLEMLLKQYATRMPRPVWDNLPDQLQFLWSRELVKRSGFRQQFERKHFASFVQGETCAMNLGASRLMRDRSAVCVCSQRHLDLIENYQLQVSQPGSWYIGLFDLKLSFSSKQTMSFADEVVDVSHLQFPVVLRAPKTGDQFVPNGKSSSRKLGDYFQAKGVGRYERQFYPILVDSKGQILVIG